jgi:hypothetical protein
LCGRTKSPRSFISSIDPVRRRPLHHAEAVMLRDAINTAVKEAMKA